MRAGDALQLAVLAAEAAARLPAAAGGGGSKEKRAPGGPGGPGRAAGLDSDALASAVKSFLEDSDLAQRSSALAAAARRALARIDSLGRAGPAGGAGGATPGRAQPGRVDLDAMQVEASPQSSVKPSASAWSKDTPSASAKKKLKKV